MAEITPASEQSRKGPGSDSGGIPRSDSLSGVNVAEQCREGPGSNSGGIPKSATGKQGVKRKLDQKTLAEKYEAILEVERGQKSKTEIAKMFNVPKNTLSGWNKKADSIKGGFLKFGPKRRNMRTGSFEDLETALIKWFTSIRDQNIPISGPLLLQKAQFFADQLGITDFKQSTGWLDRFKERHGISFKKVCGESKSVDTNSDAMADWSERLAILLKSYKPEDVYNADETSLFYKLTPEKTLEFKNVSCQGGKRSKDRLTIMVCANMSGTDKLPILVIGKSARPRCFKNVKTLPTQYESNKKAWMTSALFESWLRYFDKKMQQQGRKVAMVVDNCPAHPKVQGLKAVELIFLPPNTTSHTQPMDQGIIKNLKCHYRKHMIMKQLDAADKHVSLSLTVLDALRMLKQAWYLVTAQTIANCYRHARFSSEAVSSDSDDDEADDNIPLARLARLCAVDIEAYVDIDTAVPTCEEMTEQDIITDIQSARANNDATDDEEDSEEPETVPPPPPTIAETADALETVRRFFEASANSETELNMVCSLGRKLLLKIFERRCVNSKQTELTRLF